MLKRMPWLATLVLLPSLATGQADGTTLARFKGTQGGTLVVKEANLVHFMSCFADADFKKTNAVSFTTTLMGSPSQPLFEFILRYEPRKKIHLFSVRTYYLNSSGEFGPAIKDLPVTFTEGDGFSGKGTAKLKGRDLDVTVAITQVEPQHHEWEVTFGARDAIAFQYKFDTKKALSDKE